MTTVADILAFMDTIAPRYMKMDWDNVGLLCGSRSKAVTKILVALDPFEDVCKEAAQWGADLIVTHHPLIFRPLKAITDDTEVGRCVQMLCAEGISVISAHTNLDCAPEGVNDHLAMRLGLSDVQVVSPTGTDHQGRPWGLLRVGQVACQPLEAFLDTVKKELGCDGLRYVNSGKPVSRVAVGGGACASELEDALRAGCDTFVTSDVKYNNFWDARALGINLIDAGHFHTENPVMEPVAAKLAEHFPDIQIKVSEFHTDCMKYY